MQIFPNIKHLNIFSDSAYVPEIDANNWNLWCRNALGWVLEWDMDEGITCQLSSAKDKPFEWHPHNWHLYAPGVRYRVNYRHLKRKHENIWIVFGIDSQEMPRITRKLTVIRDPERRIADIVRHMHQVQQTGFPGYEELLGCQMQVIMAEIRCSTFSQGEGSADKPFVFNSIREVVKPREQSLLEKVDSIVIEHIYAPPSIDELASALNMSVSSLSHRFNSETNWNIIRRVRWLRIQHAKKLLLESGGYSGIKSTARKLGFSSSFYFSRVFKEVTGISPKEFLRLS